MGWVHCHKRHGAFLALAALALQIVLSFGHVHLNGAIRTSPGFVAAAHHSAAAQASRRGPPQNPAGDADDYCAICASIFLVSNSFAPAPPQLPVPDGFTRIEHSLAAAHGVIAPRRVAFRPRAPPAA
jgi:hypothetical protein